MRYFLMSVPERRQYIMPIQRQIPQLEVIRDRVRDAMETLLRTFAQTDEGAVYLEDDAELTSNFPAKIEAFVAQHPDSVINFFSRSKDDPVKGTRQLPGSRFYYTCCFYLPPGMASQIIEFRKTWDKPEREGLIGPTDTLVSAYMQARGLSYWCHVPSLVQHRQIKSTIDPRRSTKRQSATFRP